MVIGRECKRVAKEDALKVIAGLTLCNEGTIRDWLRHGQFNVTQGKNFDATGSIGPWIETDVDLTKPLRLIVRKNGEVKQDDTTANMIYSFADIIVYITTFMTLKPGDIIVTGTPVKKGQKPIRRTGSNPATPSRSNVLKSACCTIPWRTRRDDDQPRGLRHRLAGPAFALAAHPQLLAQALRNCRRIPARAGAAG